MTNRRKDPKEALKALPSSSDYEIGYGKPPAATQFKPGQSGNPTGRPKGSRNRAKPPALNEERLKDIVLEEAYRSVTVNDANGPISIPMAQAVVRSLAVNAAKGNARAQRLFTELLATTERDRRRLHDQWVEAAIDYKVQWDRELARRERLGIDGPEPLPHPDHVIVDVRTGQVHVVGPATREEKEEWDYWQAQKPVYERRLRKLQKALDDCEPSDKSKIRKEIKFIEAELLIIDNLSEAILVMRTMDAR